MKKRYEFEFAYWRNYYNNWQCQEMIWDSINKCFVDELGAPVNRIKIKDPTCDKPMYAYLFTKEDAKLKDIVARNYNIIGSIDLFDKEIKLRNLNREYLHYMDEMRYYIQDLNRIPDIDAQIRMMTPPLYQEWLKILNFK